MRQCHAGAIAASQSISRRRSAYCIYRYLDVSRTTTIMRRVFFAGSSRLLVSQPFSGNRKWTSFISNSSNCSNGCAGLALACRSSSTRVPCAVDPTISNISRFSLLLLSVPAAYPFSPSNPDSRCELTLTSSSGRL